MELTEGPIWKIPGSTWKSIKERISKRISKNRIEKIMNINAIENFNKNIKYYESNSTDI